MHIRVERSAESLLDNKPARLYTHFRLLPNSQRMQLSRFVALHREFGEITLAQMLNEWALHDLGHVRPGLIGLDAACGS